MRRRITGRLRGRVSWAGGIVAVAVTWLGIVAVRAAGDDPFNTGMGAPDALVAAYDRSTTGAGPATVVSMSLGNLRGLSGEAVNAGGRVTVDLAAGTVSSYVELLPVAGAFELWLIDNQPGQGHTTLAERGDTLRRVGTYGMAAGRHTLSESLGAKTFAGFYPDRAFVVRAGTSPVDGFVLTGGSTLFERLRHRQVRFVDHTTTPAGFDPDAASRARDFAKLVGQGRQLFVKDTFEGNGRTCATCHVEANNFTVDPAFIAALPADDPLFVAETNPALTTLERSDLLRRFGLILVNADGFDASRGFVLRGAQNVQALGNSMTPQTPEAGIDFSTNGRNPNPPERLGWGNDGAPLRDFALVAIVQHAPLTMSRRPGIDFRMPTDEELDALAAYQLSLGRQEDFDLPKLELKSALATQGKALYLDTGTLFEPGHKNCNACHFNGGGTTAIPFIPGIRLDTNPKGFSIAAATNVNETPLAVSLALPRDGGFGQVPTVFGSFGNTEDLPPPFGHLEIEEFNSPPVVESADTGPFFHNHSVDGIEAAVAFYGSPAFKNSLVGSAAPITLSADVNDPEVRAIAAFLRVLNALENIRSSIDVAERGRTMTAVDDRRDLTRLSLAETEDALEVLSGGALAGEGDSAIRSARTRLTTARVLLEVAQHLRLGWAIDRLLTVAVQQLREARSALANPATLPASFRK